jgi:hypothetical protein
MAVSEAEKKRQRAAVNKAVAQERAAFKRYAPKKKGFVRRKAEGAAKLAATGLVAAGAVKYGGKAVGKKIDKAVNNAVKKGIKEPLAKGKARDQAAKATLKKNVNHQTAKAKAAVSQAASGAKSAYTNSAPAKAGKKAIGVAKSQVSKGNARDKAATNTARTCSINFTARNA